MAINQLKFGLIEMRMDDAMAAGAGWSVQKRRGMQSTEMWSPKGVSRLC